MIRKYASPSNAFRLSRRAMLAGSLGALGAVAVGEQFVWVRRASASAGTNLPLVAELPVGAPARKLFAAKEQVLAPYLMIVAPMANDIVDDDPARLGFMGGGWWRTPAQPFNARVQEHVATLSWFYANRRNWNPYYLDPALMGRLDAALTHYLSLQHEDGSFPEYVLEEHSRAATGFGVTALAEALQNLRMPHTRARAALKVQLANAIRRASRWLLDLDNGSWTIPLSAANQTVAGLAGVARAAAVLEDASIAAALDERIDFLAAHGQSPAGFFHEPLGYDYGYNFFVMLPDLGELYRLTGNEKLVTMARRWVDFFTYASVLEPNSPGFVTFSEISSRGGSTSHPTFAVDDDDRNAMASVFTPFVPALAAFRSTAEERARARACWGNPQKASLVDPTCAAESAPVLARAVGDTSPRLWMHVTEAPDDSGESRKAAETAKLPYLVSDRFTERRKGTLEQDYLFIRRPGYYLGAFYGVRSSSSNRTGPGLLWHPRAGTFILALNNPANIPWGVTDGARNDSAVGDATISYHAGISPEGREVIPDDLSNVGGSISLSSTGVSNGARSSLALWDDGLTLTTALAGSGRMRVPLVLQPDDQVVFTDGSRATVGVSMNVKAAGVTITRDGVSLQIGWGVVASVGFTAATTKLFGDPRWLVHTVSVQMSDEMTMNFSFLDSQRLPEQPVAVSVTASGAADAGAEELAVRVTNFEPGPVSIRVVTSLGERWHDRIASGQSIIDTFNRYGAVRGVEGGTDSEGSVTVESTRLADGATSLTEVTPHGVFAETGAPE